jgi:hypothetical protein
MDCDSCHEEIKDAWREKGRGPFHFCSDTCRQEFVEAFIWQAKVNADFKEEFLKQFGRHCLNGDAKS